MEDCDIPQADGDEYEQGMRQEDDDDEDDDDRRDGDRRERRDGKTTSVQAGEDDESDDDDDDAKDAGKGKGKAKGKGKGKGDTGKRIRGAVKEQTQNMRKSYDRFDQTEMNNLLKGVEKFGFGEN